MCEVRGVILGLGFVGITLISHFPHPTSHFSYKLQFVNGKGDTNANYRKFKC